VLYLRFNLELKEVLINYENDLTLEKDNFNKAKGEVDKNYMNKCKITEEQNAKKKRIEELRNEICQRTSSLQNLEQNSKNKEKKIEKLYKEASALTKIHDWLKDKPIDLDKEIDERELAKKKEAKNYYLNENNNLKK